MPDEETLKRELEDLRSRNRELEQTLDAIRSGEVDAIVVSQGEMSQVYALEGADHPYRVLVENIQEGALTLTATGMVLYANAAYAAMRGLPLSAILGTFLRDHLAPRNRAQFDALLEASRTGAHRGEMSICSGTVSISVQVSMTPLVVNDETRISVVVTDRRQDYGRLRLLARMLDSVVDAVTAVDPEGTIIYWNEAAERMYGWQASEVVGRPMIDTVDTGVPEELARRVFGQLVTGETWFGEYMARHRDGHSFPIQATRAPVYDEDGILIAVIGTSHDISERKRAEEELRQSREWFRVMGETLPYGVWRCNTRGGAEYVSQSFLNLLEMTEDEMREFGWTHRLPPEDVEPMLKRWLHCVETGEVWDDEHRVLGPDGVYHTVMTRGQPVRNQLGEIIAWVGINLDIDERKKASEALQRSNDELQRFAYVASHDLQEPLRSIVSFSQLLERRYKGRLDQDADDYIGFIVEGGTRMQALIQDLLLVSRVETGAKPLEPTDAGEVVAGALRLLEAPIRETGGAVTVEPMPCVLADASQLEQIFTNLIANALKYHREGVPPVIAISATRNGRRWEFAVRDNGIGIEAEYYDRIFEMFRRLHTHDEYEGTGIGLAVVKRIVERHGGRVRVESTPGMGSSFFFTLPAA
ncbi:MAG: PAS domain S-box protein [Methanospirillum sp.]